MNEEMTLLFSMLAGGVLGLFFFIGLWWTVRQVASSNHVALLFICSMLLRTAVVVYGFYVIMDDSWARLLSGLIGFIIARSITIRFTRVANKSKKSVSSGHS